MQGFISLHRKLMSNPIWTDPYYLKLWTYCLFMASHKEHDQIVGNQVIKLERGQFVTGRFSLSEDMNKGMKPELKLSDRTWWRYLNNLEKWEMLTIKVTNKYSIVTIDKYDFYQSAFNRTDHQMSNSCPTDVQQLSTNNNGNKGNKKDSCPKQVYDEDSVYLRLAYRLYQNILKNNPDHKKPNLQKWADDVRKMMDIDKRTEEQIVYLMDWCQKDSFEMSNILSIEKLRKRFDELVMKVKSSKGKVTQIIPKQKPQEDPQLLKLRKMYGVEHASKPGS